MPCAPMACLRRRWSIIPFVLASGRGTTAPQALHTTLVLFAISSKYYHVHDFLVELASKPGVYAVWLLGVTATPPSCRRVHS